jgi:hypothetical protein
MTNLTDRARKALRLAGGLARARNQTTIGGYELKLGLLLAGGLALRMAFTAGDECYVPITGTLSAGEASGLPLLPGVEEAARAEQARRNDPHLGTEHLLIGLAEVNGVAAGAHPNDYRAALDALTTELAGDAEKLLAAAGATA